MLNARSVRVGLLVIAPMLAAAPVWADTIRLTGGFLTLDRSTSSIHPVSFLVASAGSDLGGQATLDGQSFPVGLGSATQGVAAINFTSSFVVPAFAGTTNISVLTPFDFSGLLQPPSGNGTPLLETLVGNGTARFDLQWVTRGADAGWDFQRARYSVEEVAAVPEPGTVMLVGSGIAMCLARRRRTLQRQGPGRQLGS